MATQTKKSKKAPNKASDLKNEQKVEEEKKIKRNPTKIIIASVLILFLLVVYFYRWYDVSKTEKYMTSPLISSKTINLEIGSLNEVSQVLSEPPSEYFVLISYTDNEDTYNLENDLQKIINDYNLNSIFYYLNVKDIMENKDYLTDINKAFNTKEITTVPTILYYRDNELVSVLKREDKNIIKAADFQKLIETETNY